MASPMSLKFAGAVIIVIIGVVLGNIYAATNVNKDTRAIIFRLEFVVVLETLIFIGVRYIWRNVNSALGPSEASDVAPSARKPLHHSTTSPNSKRNMRIRIVTLAYLIIVQCCYPASFLSVGDEPSYFGMTCFIALGIFVQLNFCIFTMNRAQNLLAFLNKKPVSKQRKATLTMTISVVYALSICTYGVYFASQPPAIKHVEIPVQKFPQEMDGLKVALVSDVHLGATVGKSKMTRIVNMVNDLDADIVALVGDFVDARVAKLSMAAEPMKNMRSKMGKFFVTGNHEYFSGGVDEWFDYWRSHGVTVLHNQHLKIRSDKDPSKFFYMAGVDDLQATNALYDGHGMDLNKAVGNCDKNHAIVLLAHQPKAAKIAMDSKHDIQLVLSGHTHGGQMFPVMVGAYLLNPFYVGLYPYKHGHVYVSQGTVYWGIPIRIATQHEITLITLRAAQ